MVELDQAKCYIQPKSRATILIKCEVINHREKTEEVYLKLTWSVRGRAWLKRSKRASRSSIVRPRPVSSTAQVIQTGEL